jgi:putative addiction module component (TIGR02574 family)
MNTLKEIEAAALKLSTHERELLANHLFQSIHIKELTAIDNAWLDESEKRYKEFLKDPSSGIPHTDHFFNDIRSELGWK